MHHPAANKMGLGGVQRHVMQLDAYARHKKFVNDYVLHYGGGREKGWKPPVAVKTDMQVR
jgi:hypothetical protein